MSGQNEAKGTSYNQTKTLRASVTESVLVEVNQVASKARKKALKMAVKSEKVRSRGRLKIRNGKTYATVFGRSPKET